MGEVVTLTILPGRKLFTTFNLGKIDVLIFNRVFLNVINLSFYILILIAFFWEKLFITFG